MPMATAHRSPSATTSLTGALWSVDDLAGAVHSIPANQTLLIDALGLPPLSISTLMVAHRDRRPGASLVGPLATSRDRD